MGNCLVVQVKIVKVMKTNGKILEYKAPIKVERILSEFAGHAISDKIPVVQHLSPDVELVGSRLYYLLPLPVPPEKVDNTLLKFSKPVVEVGQGTGVVRIKLVISKQELQAMLSKGGLSVDDMVSPHQLQKKQSAIRLHNSDNDSDVNCRGWKPLLESIPEVN